MSSRPANRTLLAFGGGAVLVVTFAIYAAVFLPLTLPTYEHHDSFFTLGVGRNCQTFDWYGVLAGRPIHSLSMCLVTKLGQGFEIARSARILGAIATALAAGVYAAFLARYLHAALAAAFALATFALPGPLLHFTMMQGVPLSFVELLVTVVGVTAVALFRRDQPRLLVGSLFVLHVIGILIALETYQPMVALVFLPVLAAIFFDRELNWRPVAYILAAFVVAAVLYALLVRVIPDLVHVPPTEMPGGFRDVHATPDIERFRSAMRWIVSTQMSGISHLWFVDWPRTAVFGGIVFGIMSITGVAIRAATAPRRAATILSIIVLFGAVEYLAFLVAPQDRSLLTFQRVKWPVEAAALVPALYLCWRMVEALPWSTIGRTVLAAGALGTMYVSHDLIKRGRIDVAASEERFALSQVRDQIAIGRNPSNMVAILLRKSPYPNPVNDELFVLTGQNPASTIGMLLVFAIETHMPGPTFEFAYDNEPERIAALLAKAKASNSLVLDYRKFRP